MAEARHTSQASLQNVISSETLQNTLAQVSSGVTEEEQTDTVATGTVLSTGSESVVTYINGSSIGDILKSLNGIASRFDFFRAASLCGLRKSK